MSLNIMQLLQIKLLTAPSQKWHLLFLPKSHLYPWKSMVVCLKKQLSFMFTYKGVGVFNTCPL